MSGEASSLCFQTYRLARDRKNLMEGLERGGYLRRKKRIRTDSTGGAAPRKA